MTDTPPAGWYPDAQREMRWWDGNRWTEHTQPTQQPSPNPTQVENSGQMNPATPSAAPVADLKESQPWYKKKRIILPAAVVALFVIVAALSSGGDENDPKIVADTSASAGPSKAPAKKEAKAPAKKKPQKKPASKKAGSKSNPAKVGQTVKLQGTQYTVKSAKTASTVGGEFMQEKASGTYVVVTLTIENKKDETKTFSDSATKFIAANGKSYSTDTDATISSMGDNEQPLFLEEMQPDLPKTGKLVFDVPSSVVKGGLLEVSDLFGRGEAYINLGL